MQFCFLEKSNLLKANAFAATNQSCIWCFESKMNKVNKIYWITFVAHLKPFSSTCVLGNFSLTVYVCIYQLEMYSHVVVIYQSVIQAFTVF